MIKCFKHKGLRQFFEKGSTAGVNTQQVGKIRLRLGVIDAAKYISDIDRPGYQLHPLSGDRAGQWAMGNNRNRQLAHHV